MSPMTHTGNFGFSFAAAVDASDLDAEIAAYKAEQASEAARPDYIVYSRIRGGFVYGSESGVHASNTAADIARSGPPTPTPPPTPDEIDEVELCGCGKPAGGWHHNVQSGTWLQLRHPFVAVAPVPAPTPPPTPDQIDEVGLCANCFNPTREWCDTCKRVICTTCNERHHRHGQPPSPRRNGTLCAAPVSTAVCNGCGRPADERCYECEWPLCAGCKDRWHRHGLPVSARRNGAAFFDRQIETYLFNARAAATELHGDLGDAAYSERVQCGVDELFN